MKKDLLKLLDLTGEEILKILDTADQLKFSQKHGIAHDKLKGKTLAMIFEKNSTRTRVSFETGMYQLGGHALFLSSKESQIGRGEPVEDTARVLLRYCDGIMIRTFAQEEVETLAAHANIPVINGLTDFCHPCQVLADLMTIRERLGSLEGRKLCFVGDGGSMANSLVVGGLLAGMQVCCVCPPGYRPAADVILFAQQYPSFQLLTDPVQGLRDADAAVTAAWSCAPGTEESERRRRDFAGYQLTDALLQNAKPACLVLHSLPAHRGEEISAAVFEQHAGEIFDEAENRLHVQKAILSILLAGQ